ncbi:hypothetical protein CEY12_20590 [Chryseobacterium sp. T16E-39]|nr:hypothetical protein CEY12_20590 [Chryseobacterium sp. T16E-39]
MNAGIFTFIGNVCAGFIIKHFWFGKQKKNGLVRPLFGKLPCYNGEDNSNFPIYYLVFTL